MTNRVVLGALPGGSYGLRVSVPGADVTNPAIPPFQKSFDSDWFNSAKIHATGSIFVPTATGYPQFTTVTFPPLPSAPPAILFRTSSFGLQPLALGNELGVLSGWTEAFDYSLARISSSSIDILRRFSTDGNFTAYYIVMKPL